MIKLISVQRSVTSTFATAADKTAKTETPQDKNLAITEKAIKDAEELANKYHKVSISIFA